MSDPFYLNIFLLNKDEVIASKVQEKAGSGIFGRAAAYAANKLVSEDKIIEKLSAGLLEKIPEAIQQMGITADMKQCFQLKSYVVMRVHITSADKIVLFNASKGPEAAEKFAQLLDCMLFLGLDEALSKIDTTVMSKVRENMMKKFSEVIPQKMLESGISVDCTVLSKEDQAEFFYATIEHMSTV